MNHSRLEGVVRVILCFERGGFIGGDHTFMELLRYAQSFDAWELVDAVDGPKCCTQISEAIARQLGHPQLTRGCTIESLKHEGNCLVEVKMESGALGIGKGDGLAFRRLLFPGMDHTPLRSKDVAVANRYEVRLLAGAVPVAIEPQALCYELGAAVEGGRTRRLVGADEDGSLDVSSDTGCDGVDGACDVGVDAFGRVIFGKGNDLLSCCVDDVINADRSAFKSPKVFDISEQR